jgi:hypothetical protein
MSKVWKVVLITAAALFILGLAAALVSLITGGSASRILSTTDVADYTKFISREDLRFLLSLLPF